MTFSLLSWNVGYGGRGEGAFSLYEGTKHRIRTPRRAIAHNIAGIEATLAKFDHDAILLQEMAGKSFLNRWHDLYAQIQRSHEGKYVHTKAPIFSLPFLPEGFKNEHSSVSAIRATHSSESRVYWLEAREKYLGCIQRKDAVVVTTIALSRPLTIMQVHLAAFDTHMHTRRAQLTEISELAKEHHRTGSVIIGGDWNMTLTNPSLSIERPDLPYLAPFASELLPEAWHIVCDERVPSIRAGQRPWGKSPVTAVVDGFVVSPDVSVRSVRTHDLGFRYSDHNPVELIVEH